MTGDLERALRELDVEWPATPDVAAAVATRIAAEGAPSRGDATGAPAAAARRPRRRVATVLAAVLLALAGGTLAVPEARSTVFRWLGIGSVEIRRGERRGEPSATPGAALDLGAPSTLAALDIPVLQPQGLGTPGVYVTTLPDGTRAASLVYDGPILVQTFSARVTPFIEKTLGMGADAERLTIDGAPAFWITGAHGFAYTTEAGTAFEEQRIADRTLLVERRDGLLLRIEGAPTRERAVALAHSVQ